MPTNANYQEFSKGTPVHDYTEQIPCFVCHQPFTIHVRSWDKGKQYPKKFRQRSYEATVEDASCEHGADNDVLRLAIVEAIARATLHTGPPGERRSDD